MQNRLSTASWLNISLSIERIFREAFPDLPVYRFALPQDVSEQRGLMEDRALFVQLVPGDLDYFQETYCTVWLCQLATPQQRFTPESNLHGVWLEEQLHRLQQWLDTGGDHVSHLWPLYDYRSLIPDAVYTQFVTDGDPSPLSNYLDGSPVAVPNTGFVVRGGNAQARLTMMKNPMVLEWVAVFQHCNHDAYQGMKG